MNRCFRARWTVFCLFIALLLAPALAQTAPLPWWKDAPGPAYQVLVYSFADSNGDGYGDLRGLTEKLDWLNDGNPATTTDLGVSAIWLSPVNPAASYHGYDVLDYKGVDPRLGTMVDFEALVAAAHARGIKVILDEVFNHSSREHPWFMSAMKSANDPYNAYYRLKVEGRSYGSSGLGRFYEVTRLDGSTMTYFSAFGGGMPDLNLDNTDVVNELKGVLAFWLSKGVDGFRFDAAKHAFDPNEVEAGAPSLALNKTFWNDLRRSARRIKPDVYFIGEVLTGSVQEVSAFAPVFDNLFDFPDQGLVLYAATRAANGGFVAGYLANGEQYARAPGFQLSPLLSNHDQDRSMSQILTRLGVDAVRGTSPSSDDNPASRAAKAQALASARLAASIYLTLPGLPYVYYGEELGMTGRRYRNDDVARRDAYPWNSSGTAPVATWMKRGDRLEAFQNSLTPSAELQSSDPKSLLAHYRRLSALRAASSAIRRGSLAEVSWPGFGDAKQLDYFREEGTDRVLVVHNLDLTAGFEAKAPPGTSLSCIWTSSRGLLALPETLDAVKLGAGESGAFAVR